jgi:hypothetical protein
MDQVASLIEEVVRWQCLTENLFDFRGLAKQNEEGVFLDC